MSGEALLDHATTASVAEAVETYSWLSEGLARDLEHDISTGDHALRGADIEVAPLKLDTTHGYVTSKINEALIHWDKLSELIPIERARPPNAGGGMLGGSEEMFEDCFITRQELDASAPPDLSLPWKDEVAVYRWHLRNLFCSVPRSDTLEARTSEGKVPLRAMQVKEMLDANSNKRPVGDVHLLNEINYVRAEAKPELSTTGSKLQLPSDPAPPTGSTAPSREAPTNNNDGSNGSTIGGAQSVDVLAPRTAAVGRVLPSFVRRSRTVVTFSLYRSGARDAIPEGGLGHASEKRLFEVEALEHNTLQQVMETMPPCLADRITETKRRKSGERDGQAAGCPSVLKTVSLAGGFVFMRGVFYVTTPVAEEGTEDTTPPPPPVYDVANLRRIKDIAYGGGAQEASRDGPGTGDTGGAAVAGSSTPAIPTPGNSGAPSSSSAAESSLEVHEGRGSQSEQRLGTPPLAALPALPPSYEGRAPDPWMRRWLHEGGQSWPAKKHRLLEGARQLRHAEELRNAAKANGRADAGEEVPSEVRAKRQAAAEASKQAARALLESADPGETSEPLGEADSSRGNAKSGAEGGGDDGDKAAPPVSKGTGRGRGRGTGRGRGRGRGGRRGVASGGGRESPAAGVACAISAQRAKGKRSTAGDKDEKASSGSDQSAAEHDGRKQTRDDWAWSSGSESEGAVGRKAPREDNDTGGRRKGMTDKRRSTSQAGTRTEDGADAEEREEPPSKSKRNSTAGARGGRGGRGSRGRGRGRSTSESMGTGKRKAAARDKDGVRDVRENVSAEVTRASSGRSGGPYVSTSRANTLQQSQTGGKDTVANGNGDAQAGLRQDQTADTGPSRGPPEDDSAASSRKGKGRGGSAEPRGGQDMSTPGLATAASAAAGNRGTKRGGSDADTQTTEKGAPKKRGRVAGRKTQPSGSGEGDGIKMRRKLGLADDGGEIRWASDVTVGELRVALCERYMFVHHCDCAHYLVVSDVRLEPVAAIDKGAADITDDFAGGNDIRIGTNGGGSTTLGRGDQCGTGSPTGDDGAVRALPEEGIGDTYPRLSFRTRPNFRRCGVCKTKVADMKSFGHPLSDQAPLSCCRGCVDMLYYDAEGRPFTGKLAGDSAQSASSPRVSEEEPCLPTGVEEGGPEGWRLYHLHDAP